MRVRSKRDLLLGVGGPDTRTLHRDAAAAEGDLTGLMAVAHRGAVGHLGALRSDDLGHLSFQHLGQDPEANADSSPSFAALTSSPSRSSHRPALSWRLTGPGVHSRRLSGWVGRHRLRGPVTLEARASGKALRVRLDVR